MGNMRQGSTICGSFGELSWYSRCRETVHESIKGLIQVPEASTCALPIAGCDWIGQGVGKFPHHEENRTTVLEEYFVMTGRTSPDGSAVGRARWRAAPPLRFGYRPFWPRLP